MSRDAPFYEGVVTANSWTWLGQGPMQLNAMNPNFIIAVSSDVPPLSAGSILSTDQTWTYDGYLNVWVMPRPGAAQHRGACYIWSDPEFLISASGTTQLQGQSTTEQPATPSDMFDLDLGLDLDFSMGLNMGGQYLFDTINLDQGIPGYELNN